MTKSICSLYSQKPAIHGNFSFNLCKTSTWRELGQLSDMPFYFWNTSSLLLKQLLTSRNQVLGENSNGYWKLVRVTALSATALVGVTACNLLETALRISVCCLLSISLIGVLISKACKLSEKNFLNKACEMGAGVWLIAGISALMGITHTGIGGIAAYRMLTNTDRDATGCRNVRDLADRVSCDASHTISVWITKIFE